MNDITKVTSLDGNKQGEEMMIWNAEKVDTNSTIDLDDILLYAY